MAGMSKEQWQAVDPHLDRALKLDREGRKALLDSLRAERPDVAEDLEILLAAYAIPDSAWFLQNAPELPETTLAGQAVGAYTLISAIGQGGMGSVWLARRSDGRFEGHAAVKLLNASLVGRAGEERFRREGSILARLAHPHIARLLDAGVSPTGQPYLVLEYVEGEPIDRYCERKGLTIRERLGLFLDVLDAVAHAHSKQIVHRDIKPSNVLVGEEGRVELLDFGIAKLLEAETGGGEATALTREAGGALTPEYAAPEQVAGGTITTATDVYALGVVLYELLVGDLPFDRVRMREAGWAGLERILREEEPVRPSSRTALRRELEGDLDWITLKALEKDRSRRYATAAEFAEDIQRHLKDEPVSAGPPGAAYRLKKLIRRRRVALAAVAVFVVAALGAVFLERSRIATGGLRGKRLAVLPFENLGPPSDDYLADGIADAVRGKLTSLPGIQVIARGSSTPYRKTSKTPGQIAKELGVGYLLTATVRWQKGPGEAGRVQVTPELVEVSSSGAPTSKWQQPFDVVLTDVFEVQANIATRVAHGLGMALGTGEEKRLSDRPTRSLTAYDAYLKGEEASRGMGDKNPYSVRKAMAFYEQAVALDPKFAQAWARVSLACSSLYRNGTPTRELDERARKAAEKSLALAPDHPEGYVALGYYEVAVHNDSERALEQYTKGLQVAPGNAELISAIGQVERNLGHWSAAVDHLRQAERLDPRSVITQLRLGQVLFWLRRYPEARAAYDRGLALAPASLDMIEWKVMTFLGQGDLSGARAVVSSAMKEVEPTALVAYVANSQDLGWVLDEPQRELLLRLTPSAFDNDRAAWAISLAQAYSLKGDPSNARIFAKNCLEVLEEQLQDTPNDAQRHVFLGLALAYLGRKEEAIQEGRRAVDLAPLGRNATHGAYLRHQLVKIYTLVGEPEKALDVLEPLLKIPYDLSPGWLSIDPNFDPLRANPRFQRLIARGTQVDAEFWAVRRDAWPE
jgi:serine/threonine protein kinase/TolB-like protein/tetratricopeptide (TPR) repeat protein